MLQLLNQFWTWVLGKIGITVQRYICFRPYVLPVVVGLCLGITIHMMFVPFLEEGCDASVLRYATRPKTSAEQSPTKSVQRQHHKTFEPDDIFEARLVPPVATNSTSNKDGVKPKVVRPRYVSTELGIREKLFVAVLTSGTTVDTFGVAMDKTIAKHVTKIIFFSTTKPSVVPNGLPMVTFGDKHAELLPVHILKYIAEHYAETFDFYMFVSDRTYLRAEKLTDLVEHISVRNDVHMGAPSVDANFCSLEGGVVISQSVMSRVLPSLDWCLGNPHPDNPSITLGRCVHHATQLLCSSTGGDQIYRYFPLNDFDFDDDISSLKGRPEFNQSLTFYPMPDDISLYKIHRYFCFVDLNETRQKIQVFKDDMIELSQSSPGGRDGLTWPLGVPDPHKPANRFGVIQWTYFTETHLYLDSELINVRELSGADKQDVQDIMRYAMAQLDQHYNRQFVLRRLVNGYRRFDPTRGMEYMLDLLLQDTTNKNAEVYKRVHLVRPLGQAEIVPVSYVSENMMINMVIFLQPAHVDMFDVFLDGYGRSCLQTNEEISLTVAFLYPSVTSEKKEKDLFAKPKMLIGEFRKKYNTKDKLTWKAFEDKLSEIEIMDDIMLTFKSDVLILTGTVNMEFSADAVVHYLNRVRMNTIKGEQVFFPMGFWQYKPNLIYNKRAPSSVEVGQRLGRYDTDSFEHSSFYSSDYKTSRKTLTPVAAKMGDIITMFVNFKKFHIFRAVEPNLKLKWMNLTCAPTTTAEKYQECVSRNTEGLASQHHLALLIYEQRKEIIKQPETENQKESTNIKDKPVIHPPAPKIDPRLLKPMADIEPAL